MTVYWRAGRVRKGTQTHSAGWRIQPLINTLAEFAREAIAPGAIVAGFL
jgi:hypothetical protein